MENKETAHEALNRIQKELKAPKGNRNSFGNYNYRSAEDIVEAVKPLLGNMILTISDDIVLIGDRFYVKATAKISLGDDMREVSAFAREPLEKKGMDTAQITGATSSYARKYALNGLFCIDDTKDADTMDNSTTGQNKPSKPISGKNDKQFMEDLEPTPEEVLLWTNKLTNTTTLKELRDLWKTVPPMVVDKIAHVKDSLKVKLGGK